MNRDIALRDGDRGWQVGPHLGAPLPSSDQAPHPGIDLARLLRILHHWRWLILGAVALGYRPAGVGSIAALVALALAVGLGVALFSVAVALRFATSAAVNGVTTVFFGLSFFTGVLAPADQLSGWLRAVARVNPMTYLLEAMRSVEGAATNHSPTLAALFFALLFAGGVVACMLSLRKRSALR